MGLGMGVPNFEPALLLLCQEIAEWGLCVCMPRLHEAPHSLHDGGWGGDMPEPLRKGRDRPWEGRAGAFYGALSDSLSNGLKSATQTT